jgi:hypothetical protein
MPRNHDFATHRLMRQVAAEGDWRDRLEGAREESPVKPPEFYHDLLAPRAAGFTIWETNYIQVMDGPRRSSPGCAAPASGHFSPGSRAKSSRSSSNATQR